MRVKAHRISGKRFKLGFNFLKGYTLGIIGNRF